ncbi:hypothetical protein V474_14595 [Novosphingobium barchaimii LL02]|uniref:JAB domain-containing protein n=1 Tax=Novosphingobium barchaimii LL02 TaxID=1114963 RepID=A0A0J7XY28_9SPHN|nr:Mov34/MPN/PAD-1 family protein [Novosphingobium barchaimii]KMS56193.1 hypothetical protein V474_14595 [Novosphingobium barchaimii LL02]
MRIEFPAEQRSRMRNVVRRAGRSEIGGILMAEQLDPGAFRIVGFSVDPTQGSAAHFVRSVEHHNEELTAFFDKTGHDYSRFNYLGEWHSHPNHHPVPSGEDIRSMQTLVNGERDIPFALLLVVRTSWWRLTGTATIFERQGFPKPIGPIANIIETKSE